MYCWFVGTDGFPLSNSRCVNFEKLVKVCVEAISPPEKCTTKRAPLSSSDTITFCANCFVASWYASEISLMLDCSVVIPETRYGSGERSKYFRILIPKSSSEK